MHAAILMGASWIHMLRDMSDMCTPERQTTVTTSFHSYWRDLNIEDEEDCVHKELLDSNCQGSCCCGCVMHEGAELTEKTKKYKEIGYSMTYTHM
jgi:hypothetical protein